MGKDAAKKAVEVEDEIHLFFQKNKFNSYGNKWLSAPMIIYLAVKNAFENETY